jgi:hypothetical protein
MAVTPVPPKGSSTTSPSCGIVFDVFSHYIGRSPSEIRMHPVMPRVLLPGGGNCFKDRVDMSAIHLAANKICQSREFQNVNMVRWVHQIVLDTQHDGSRKFRVTHYLVIKS